MNKYREKYPERAKANTAVASAIRYGKLITPSNCEVCGDTKKLHAHHSDYKKQLDVLWVCSQCHKDIHHPNKKENKEKKKKISIVVISKKSILSWCAKGLRDSGYSYNNIAKKLNIGKGTAYKWINRPNYY